MKAKDLANELKKPGRVYVEALVYQDTMLVEAVKADLVWGYSRMPAEYETHMALHDMGHNERRLSEE